MRFAVVANVKRPGAAEALNRFSRWAEKNEHQFFASDELSDVVPGSARLLPRADLPHNADVVVSMGGDGTLLACARTVGEAQVPILGINLGSLGFMTQQNAKEMITALDAIVKGNYTIEKRMILRARIEGSDKLDNPYALNDVVVNNGPISRIIDIHLLVDGESIVTYRADGLIIATPTGSTAYSMAAGGPILHPGLNAIISTPISSFSLNSRPMVFSSEAELEIRTGAGAERPTLTIDGQVMVPLGVDDRVVISRADFNLRLIVFPENSFYKVLRRKLHWGVTPASDEW